MGTNAHVHQNDRTSTRIRAYLASMQSMRDCIFRDDIEAANRRGVALIERIAESAEEGEKPTLRLSASQAADVLSFIACAEPVDPAAWWKDQNETSHVSGFLDVLGALEDSLRSATEPCGRAEPVAEARENRTSNVTPIRPGVPTQPPLPMSTDRIGPEVYRIHEVVSVIELAERAMQQISGDKDPVKIVEELSVPGGALRNARATLLGVAERLEAKAHKAEGDKS